MEDTGLAQKWRQEGREEGLDVGRQEGREELVTQALSKGKSIADISDFTGLDTKTVQ
jgi:predicted transposase YdaD